MNSGGGRTPRQGSDKTTRANTSRTSPTAAGVVETTERTSSSATRGMVETGRQRMSPAAARLIETVQQRASPTTTAQAQLDGSRHHPALSSQSAAAAQPPPPLPTADVSSTEPLAASTPLPSFQPKFFAKDFKPLHEIKATPTRYFPPFQSKTDKTLSAIAETQDDFSPPKEHKRFFAKLEWMKENLPYDTSRLDQEPEQYETPPPGFERLFERLAKMKAKTGPRLLRPPRQRYFTPIETSREKPLPAAAAGSSTCPPATRYPPQSLVKVKSPYKPKLFETPDPTSWRERLGYHWEPREEEEEPQPRVPWEPPPPDPVKQQIMEEFSARAQLIMGSKYGLPVPDTPAVQRLREEDIQRRWKSLQEVYGEPQPERELAKIHGPISRIRERYEQYLRNRPQLIAEAEGTLHPQRTQTMAGPTFDEGIRRELEYSESESSPSDEESEAESDITPIYGQSDAFHKALLDESMTDDVNKSVVEKLNIATKNILQKQAKDDLQVALDYYQRKWQQMSPKAAAETRALNLSGISVLSIGATRSSVSLGELINETDRVSTRLDDSSLQTELTAAVGGLGKAVTLSQLRSATAAAEIAAQGVAPEVAEEAAAVTARDYQMHFLDEFEEQVRDITSTAESPKLVSIIGYVGITRPREVTII